LYYPVETRLSKTTDWYVDCVRALTQSEFLFLCVQV